MAPPRSCLPFLLHFCLVPLLIASQNPLLYVAHPHTPDLRQEIVASLEKAQHSLQRAGAVHGYVGECTAQLRRCIGSLNWVETYLLEDSLIDAGRQLQNAKDALSACADALQLSSEGTPAGSVLILVKQASSHIEAATASFNSLKNEDSSRGDGGKTYDTEDMIETQDRGKECTVDGTTCQFSPCGQGKLLPKCAIGFGAGVTGGAAGQSYVVTRPDDNPVSPHSGTLRYAVGLGGHGGGVWISFSRSMVITLQAMLWVRSSTTIDGRGFNITITGRMLVVGGVSNVILHNFQINSMDESDTVHIFARSSKVWVDHVTSFDGKLGLVSVVQGSTDVTISNCQLSNRNFNMLLGASDSDLEDQNMRVTVYRNWFKDSMQRMPHCRWGYCHVVNNLYTNWGYYAIGGRVHATILSESNVFIQSRRSEVTPWFPGAGSDFDNTPLIHSKNDLLLNGTTFHEFVQVGIASAPQYRRSATYPPIYPTGKLANLVQNCAGALVGYRLQQCTVYVRY